MSARSQSEGDTGAREFTTTHWSVVLSAGRDSSAQASDALAKLCRTYWWPLYAFVRRQGHSPHDAQDLTQEFFARLLEKDYLGAGAHQRGRRGVCQHAEQLYVGDNSTHGWDFTTECCARGGGAWASTLNNCIVYSNTGPAANYASCTLNYSCTTPQPFDGLGNITNAPLFVDQASGNLRLQSNSPCINAGLNAFAPAGPDLDGNLRIVGGTVDIGAYELQSPASVISYAWLQQYALPTDGSADAADPDGDRLNNWQEWRCATDPTNALSALRMLAPVVVGSDLLVRWESVADRAYFLERSTAASSAFTPLATGIPGQPGTTTFTHTNAIGAGPWFYRVGVSTP